ncbi:MAG: STM4011 family radical SAM protein [Lachnospiraceae bacterium]|nr:STM4011 family radical SAM protein [Lachnospiraceae bacterium]
MENKSLKQIFYRGLIKSCNYSCAYCPFSKHVSKRELEADAVELVRFVHFVEQRTDVGAVQIVPYGEALIHEYYWEAMAVLSKLPQLELVGCQTNLSFPVEHMLKVFQQAGGCREKLRLWCTFHPTMVSGECFLNQCKLLEKEQVGFCVGSVGVPEQRERLTQLREKLSKAVYMWVNPMDGLGRPYTEAEIADFVKIDAFFPYLLKHTKAQAAQCKGCQGKALFVHSNGDVTPCNISRKRLGNIYQSYDLEPPLEIKGCGQRECSCYLAYSNRMDMPEMVCYGKYPAFRVATVPQAMFLDVDGTLIKEGCESIDEQVVKQLAHWSQYAGIYLATSLPLVHALKKCHAIKPFLSGGVFANGGMVCLFQEKKTWITSIEQEVVQTVLQLLRAHSVKVRIYEQDGKVYKITGTGRKLSQTYDVLREKLAVNADNAKLTLVLEGKYLEITGREANKLTGVQRICEYYGYEKDKVLAAGDSENDKDMLDFFPMSVLRRNIEAI